MDVPRLAQTNVMRNLRYHVEHAMQFSLDRHATNMLAVAKKYSCHFMQCRTE